jgi:hypothetical protein
MSCPARLGTTTNPDERPPMRRCACLPTEPTSETIAVPARPQCGQRSVMAQVSKSVTVGGGLTVIHQVIENELRQPVGVMLAGIRESDDFVDDDLSHRVIAVALEQKRVAHSLKRGTQSLNVRRVDLVLRERHRLLTFPARKAADMADSRWGVPSRAFKCQSGGNARGVERALERRVCAHPGRDVASGPRSESSVR